MNDNFLLGQADAALAAHRLAKRSGEPAAIGATRRQLERLQRDLGALKTERSAIAAIKAAHAAPMRLGTL
jgi:hypothetical protein